MALGVVVLLAAGVFLAQGRSLPNAVTAVGVDVEEPVVTAAVPTEPATADDRLLEDVRAALAAWGEFGVTGDIDTVAASFDPDGPQYAQLLAEAETMEPTGGPPLRIAVTGPQVVSLDDGVAVVEGSVSVAGGTAAPQRWQIEMRREAPDGRWRLWTVVAVP